MPATLSVSGQVDCKDVVETMKKLGIMGDVTPNVTVVDGGIENGCRINIASRPHMDNLKTLWVNLQEQFTLGCAHVKIGELQSGCILDFMRKSECPGNND